MYTSEVEIERKVKKTYFCDNCGKQLDHKHYCAGCGGDFCSTCVEFLEYDMFTEEYNHSDYQDKLCKSCYEKYLKYIDICYGIFKDWKKECNEST